MDAEGPSPPLRLHRNNILTAPAPSTALRELPPPPLSRGRINRDPCPYLDAVIIGAGHNGLVCAAYLGRRAGKVRVLERRDVVGGAA